LWVAAELEGLDPMRLQPVLLPECDAPWPWTSALPWPSVAYSNAWRPWACAGSR
jgi:hypothetical protein